MNVGRAQGDVIAYLLTAVPEALLALDGTNPKYGVHQFLSLNCCPIAARCLKLDHRLKGSHAGHCSGLVSVRGFLHPPTCHPVLLVDLGFAAVELFHALDALEWDWLIRAKGAVWVQSSGRYRPLYGYALECPGTFRFGRRYRDNAYPCGIIMYAEPGYRDSWYLVVLVGLREWESGRVVGA